MDSDNGRRAVNLEFQLPASEIKVPNVMSIVLFGACTSRKTMNTENMGTMAIEVET